MLLNNNTMNTTTTEYNVYSGEGVFSSYRLAYAHTQKNYYIYNHLGSKAVEVDSVGNIIDYVQYSPFGDHTSTSLSAGGVRKYDYEIGRFTSVDPLWEKYIGWTGYQYSGNNPVNLVDRDGLLAEKKNGPFHYTCWLIF